MKARIFSKAIIRSVKPVAIRAGLAALSFACGNQFCQTFLYAQQPAVQSPNGLYTDPQTGIVYRQVAKTVERPVVETKMESRNQTVYRPETVTETKPENRTVYTPVVEYQWQPRVHGRWNPFQQPTVAYHHVPNTRWEARNQVVNRTQQRTQWVAENRKVDVPKRLVRMQREEKIEYQAVGKVAPPAAASQGPTNALAARLRPLDAKTQVAPIAGSNATSSPVYLAPNFNSRQIAASSVGRMTSDPPRRNSGQSGMRANDLYPTGQVHGHALPPASGGVGIASLPSLPFMR